MEKAPVCSVGGPTAAVVLRVDAAVDGCKYQQYLEFVLGGFLANEVERKGGSLEGPRVPPRRD
jgi:hypothetical protein